MSSAAHRSSTILWRLAAATSLALLVAACSSSGTADPAPSSTTVDTSTTVVETPAPSPSTHPLLAPSPTTHLGLSWFSPAEPAAARSVDERWAEAQAASTVGRVLVDWVELEPQRGDHRADLLDEALGELTDAGLAPMVTIAAVDVSGTPFPEWLGGFDPRDAAEAYVEMIAAMLPTLRAHGVWLLAIANEPPLADGELDVDDFASFVERVEAGAQRLAPDLAVTFTFAGGDPFLPEPAIDRMIETVDAFSVNHYCLGGDLRRLPLEEATAQIDRLVERAGDLPVVFQELGCPAGEANGSSDADQLAWFEVAFEHLDSIERVRAAFVFEFLDWSPAVFELDYGSTLEGLTEEVGPDFVERFETWLLTAGLVRSDGSARPAFELFLEQAGA
ncbi:MAG: hypothetical protein AAFZ07_00585 [Actinomycetota bacterium]